MIAYVIVSSGSFGVRTPAVIVVEIFANDEIALEPLVPACAEVVTVAKFAFAAGDALNVGAIE